MNRREAIKNGLACLMPSVIVPKQTPHTQPPEAIKGVGVIRYPPGGQIELPDGTIKDNVAVAREIAENVCQGSIICMPSCRDEFGELLWDFYVAGGDPKQVQVKRSDDA